MPTKNVTRIVHDTGPHRADLRSGDCLAPATPRGTDKGRSTAREDRIVAAYQKGADLDRLVVNYHVRPEILIRILHLDPAELDPGTYEKMSKTYDDLRARAIR